MPADRIDVRGAHVRALTALLGRVVLNKPSSQFAVFFAIPHFFESRFPDIAHGRRQHAAGDDLSVALDYGIAHNPRAGAPGFVYGQHVVPKSGGM